MSNLWIPPRKYNPNTNNNQRPPSQYTPSDNPPTSDSSSNPSSPVTATNPQFFRPQAPDTQLLNDPRLAKHYAKASQLYSQTFPSEASLVQQQQPSPNPSYSKPDFPPSQQQQVPQKQIYIPQRSFNAIQSPQQPTLQPPQLYGSSTHPSFQKTPQLTNINLPQRATVNLPPRTNTINNQQTRKLNAPNLGGAPAAAMAMNSLALPIRGVPTPRSLVAKPFEPANVSLPLNDGKSRSIQNNGGLTQENNSEPKRHTVNPSALHNLDDLLEQGKDQMSKHSYEDAFTTWKLAAEMAVSECDLLREAKAHANMSAAARTLGKYDDALQHAQWSWKLSCIFVEETQKVSALPWVDLVKHYVETDSHEDFVFSSNNPMFNLKRFSLSSGGADFIDISNHGSDAQGPAIVVWFMMLATTFGNAYFALGQMDSSIYWHDMCLKLADAVFEEFSMPVENVGIFNANTPKLKMSYVHKSTLLAQIRSFTHIGLCHQQLGREEDAYNFHLRANEYLKYYLYHNPNLPRPANSPSPPPPTTPKEEVAPVKRTLPTAANPPALNLKTAPSTYIPESPAKYQAVIIANVGNSYYAKGLLPVAMDRHLQAAGMFRELEDPVGHARESANIGALWVDVGRIITNLEWLKRCEKLSEVLSYEADATIKKYWGVGKTQGLFVDDSIGVAPGMKFLEGGATRLYDQLEVLKKYGDWTSMSITWLNLAAGYCLMNQPHWALHNISRLLPGISKSGSKNFSSKPTLKSASTTNLTLISKQPQQSHNFDGIPPMLLPIMYYLIIQGMILLERYNEAAKAKDDTRSESGAGTEISGNSRTSRGSDRSGSIPAAVADHRIANELIKYIQSLIQSRLSETELRGVKFVQIDLTDIQDQDVGIMIDQLIAWTRVISRKNIEIANGAASSMLIPNLEVNYGVRGDTKNFGGWSALSDMNKQQWVLSQDTMAKVMWLKGGILLDESLGSEIMDYAKSYCLSATESLAKAALEVVKAGGGEVYEENKDALTELVEIAVTDSKLGLRQGWESRLLSGNVSAAATFALVADVLAYTIVYGSNNPEIRRMIIDRMGVMNFCSDKSVPGFDLGSKNYEFVVQSANEARREVLKAARLLCGGTIGCCDLCVDEAVSAVDEHGEAVVRFMGPSEKPEDGEEGGVRKPTYPCKHFQWSTFKLR
ncbi:hypothetical protein HK098_007478 [Nowakowskiella sp. JEL0407]|nr:hypothetical protein HK098_007478 [Nowakowskiella sp. JEL0407]